MSGAEVASAGQPVRIAMLSRPGTRVRNEDACGV